MVSETIREFDIVILGATGYTGQYVIEELANSTIQTELKWAIAGRSTERLKKSLKIVQEYLGKTINILDTTIIETDVKNASSLNDLCKRTKLVLNCVGPYKLYGEPVVKACIENGTHHVDISGEISFLENIQAKYFEDAQNKKIYIVGACGNDSIPSDYGMSLMKKNFPGDLNSVEYYLEIKRGPSGITYNKGTFNSAALSLWDTLKTSHYDQLLKKVFKKDLPPNKHALSKRLPPLFYSSIVKGWCLWFPGPDERVLKRSQMFRYEYLNERPIESHGYFKTSSFLSALFIVFVAVFFGLMSLFSFGRYLLEKYPSFFSAGAFSNEGPTRQQIKEGSVVMTLWGEGWKEKLLDPNDQHSTKPDTKTKLVITGPEPFYPLTAMCMVQAGITILQDSDKMPLEGGVLTPGVAFEKTSLRDRLQKRGMNFKFEAC